MVRGKRSWWGAHVMRSEAAFVAPSSHNQLEHLSLRRLCSALTHLLQREENVCAVLTRSQTVQPVSS